MIDSEVPTTQANRSRDETSRHAVTAMAFAVLGTLGLFIVGPILALVFAGKARRHLVEDQGRPGAELAASATTIAAITLILQVVISLMGITVAVVMAVTAKDAVTSVTKSTGVLGAPADAGPAFSSLCTTNLHGDAGACGCALSVARDHGVTDAMLALDLTQYRATQIFPEEIAVPLRSCGVISN